GRGRKESASAEGSRTAHARSRRAAHRPPRVLPHIGLNVAMIVGMIERQESLVVLRDACRKARGNQLQLHVFLLSADHANHWSLRIISAQGFGIPVFELVLFPIERKQAIGARSQSLRNETSIRTHPYLGELPAAIRQGNAVDMRRGLPTQRCIRSPASCVAACEVCAA